MTNLFNVNNHVKLGAALIANSPQKVKSTGANTAEVDANFAQNFFKAMQLDFGKYNKNSNGSDFSVAVIDKEIETINKALENGLPLFKSIIAKTELAMLEAIKAGDSNSDGAVSATEMNNLLAGGSLKINYLA